MFDKYWMRLDRQADIKTIEIFSIHIAIMKREPRTVSIISVSTGVQCIQFFIVTKKTLTLFSFAVLHLYIDDFQPEINCIDIRVIVRRLDFEIKN